MFVRVSGGINPDSSEELFADRPGVEARAEEEEGRKPDNTLLLTHIYWKCDDGVTV